ncbi:MAG: hypothetical protein ACYTEQ_27145 [Planctomycetota bacterium]
MNNEKVVELAEEVERLRPEALADRLDILIDRLNQLENVVMLSVTTISSLQDKVERLEILEAELAEVKSNQWAR